METRVTARLRSALALVILLASFPALTQQPQRPPITQVRYSVSSPDSISVGALLATVDGKTYPVIPKSEVKCMQIVSQ
jgi:hypothetical protein